MAISEYLKYLRVPLDKINMNNAAHHKHSFVGRSFSTLSKTNIPRIFTGITAHQFMLTAVSKTTQVASENGVVLRVVLQDDPVITIGMPLISLGIPVSGIITGLMVLPSATDEDVVRVIINYFSPVK
jgi:hypothetical protein